MRYTYKLVFATLFFLAGMTLHAQENKVKDMHKVKRSETIFGIANKYGITVNDLIKANPEMNTPGYELKKGDYIVIPATKGSNSSNVSNNTSKASSTVSGTKVKVGVLLPLHNVDGDGRRMLEYYRGLLLACDDLKKEGVSVDVSAWNTPIDGNVYNTLVQDRFKKCDIVFGPLYTKQVKPTADMAKSNGTKLVIPFSIEGNEVNTNPEIFQVYQSPEVFYNGVISQFAYRFSNYNVVVIDCNDRSSDKGIFTFGLRKVLGERNIPCNVTNIDSGEELFAKAFSSSKPNMVVLNTGRSPELNRVIAKLDALQKTNPSLAISMFGYTEWLMYEKYNKTKFFKYDTYVPTNSYYNPYSSKVKSLEAKYRRLFKSEMMDYLPRFAITGYDHGMFFIKGIGKYGKNFNGAEADKNALQTPMHFARTGTNGGFRNTSLMFVHYNRNSTISIINF